MPELAMSTAISVIRLMESQQLFPAPSPGSGFTVPSRARLTCWGCPCEPGRVSTAAVAQNEVCVNVLLTTSQILQR